MSFLISLPPITPPNTHKEVQKSARPKVSMVPNNLAGPPESHYIFRTFSLKIVQCWVVPNSCDILNLSGYIFSSASGLFSFFESPSCPQYRQFLAEVTRFVCGGFTSEWEKKLGIFTSKWSATPWKIDGWNLEITHLQPRKSPSKPPWRWVPAIHVQGWMRFANVEKPCLVDKHGAKEAGVK